MARFCPMPKFVKDKCTSRQPPVLAVGVKITLLLEDAKGRSRELEIVAARKDLNGIVRPHPARHPSIANAASVAMGASVPLPLFIFVATMAVNHDQGKKDAKAHEQND